MRQPMTSRTRRVVLGLGIGVAVGGLGASLALTAPAGAAPGWSATPTSSLAGGSVRVASSPTALCQWLQPSDPDVTAPAEPETPDEPARASPGDPRVSDGSTVELRLEAPGALVGLGSVDVTAGGAWSGTVTIPDAATAPPGAYDLLARCVVDDPALDGVRSFDFDPLPFTIVEGPPPATLEVPTELIPPITVTNPLEVQGTEAVRNPATRRVAAAVPTLPNTGDGTLAVALTGLGAVLLGAATLRFGARARPDVRE